MTELMHLLSVGVVFTDRKRPDKLFQFIFGELIEENIKAEFCTLANKLGG